MPKQKKQFELTSKDKAVYRLLESNPNKWWTKEEIMEALPYYFSKADATSHDICSTLNSIRLRLNKGRACGMITHYTMIKDNAFKLATNEQELKPVLQKMEDDLWKDYIRYLETKGVIKENGQGKLFDCNGNPIDEHPYAKRFNMPFEF